MKVAIYLPPGRKDKSNPLGGNCMRAMAEGAAALGYEADFREQTSDSRKDADHYDAACIWGITSKRHRGPTRYRDPIRHAYNYLDKPIVVMERGYVRREEYHSAALWDLGGAGIMPKKHHLGDRWEALGVEMAPLRTRKRGPMIICGQVPADTSCQEIDIEEWMRKTYRVLKERTDGCIIRPHPRAPNPNVPGAEVSTLSLAEDIERACLFRTWSSTVGVDALIGGVPVDADGKRSVVPPAIMSEVSRQRWACQLAYRQWTLDEMREGLPWRHLLQDYV